MSGTKPPDDRAKRRLSPVAAVKAFFTHDVRLRRDGRRVGLEFVPRDASATSTVAPSTAADEAAALPFANLPMAVALKALLDSAPNSRKTLRHLAAVERHLMRRGVLQLDRLTLPALEVLLRQLDGLTAPPLSQPLGELRAQIAAALALLRRQMHDTERDRASAAAAAAHMAALSGLLGEKLEVTELDDLDFDAAFAADEATEEAKP